MKLTAYCRHLKRALDVALAAIALVVLAPLMLAIGAAILLEDGRPILFRQTRVGKDEVLFSFLKFRSMAPNTRDVPSAQATTLQVTRVGRLIRRLSFDELPQLLNILRGEMSIVGPRPAIPAQRVLCELRRVSGASGCLPGLTGLAQINSYDGMPEEEKAEWDAEYARELCFWLDVTIVVRTVGYLVKPPPTY